jgi:TATA-binding protein-associated factor Taf7
VLPYNQEAEGRARSDTIHLHDEQAKLRDELNREQAKADDQKREAERILTGTIAELEQALSALAAHKRRAAVDLREVPFLYLPTIGLPCADGLRMGEGEGSPGSPEA